MKTKMHYPLQKSRIGHKEIKFEGMVTSATTTLAKILPNLLIKDASETSHRKSEKVFTR